MRDKNPFRFYQRVGDHIGPKRFFGWALGVNAPIALALVVFTRWHISVVETPQPVHDCIRAVVGLVAFGIGMLVVWWKIFRPAIQAVEKEDDDKVTQPTD